MAGPEFYQTGYGRRFFDAQLPQLISALERIASALERHLEPHKDVVMDVPTYPVPGETEV